MRDVLVTGLWSAMLLGLLGNYQAVAQSRIGLIFEGFGLNVVQLTNINYSGECPGTERRSVTTYFTNAAVPAQEDLRVKLINTTDGVNPKNPPSKETSYRKDNLSASFTTLSSTRGEFGLINGPNMIKYEIFQRKTREVVSQGDFQVEARITTVDQPRWANWQAEKLVCLDGNSTSKCDQKKLMWKSEKVCPDQRVVNSRTRPYLK